METPQTAKPLPDYCPVPTWGFSGNERVVKIGYKCFNYMDYLEAYCGQTCYTHRGELALHKIRAEIIEAMKGKK